jgi:hypothetical protein
MSATWHLVQEGWKQHMTLSRQRTTSEHKYIQESPMSPDTLVSTLPPDTDYLWHLGTQVFWNREQPQLFTCRLDLDACKHLGEDVGSHLSSRDIARRKVAFDDFIA